MVHISQLAHSGLGYNREIGDKLMLPKKAACDLIFANSYWAESLSSLSLVPVELRNKYNLTTKLTLVVSECK